jgi:hypothetical protein
MGDDNDKVSTHGKLETHAASRQRRLKYRKVQSSLTRRAIHFSPDLPRVRQNGVKIRSTAW